MTAATGRPVYLACGPTDLRKSIDALAAIVQLTFHRDPCSSALFVFCNRDQTKLKILEWDDQGFWLLSRIRDNSHYAEKSVMPKNRLCRKIGYAEILRSLLVQARPPGALSPGTRAISG